MKDAAKDPERHAMDSALFLLKFRGRTESEMARRLEMKRFAPEVVQKTIDRLKELGLLNDERLGREWVAGRRSAGQGDIKIRHMLLMRGMARETADKVLAEPSEASEAAKDEKARAWDALLRRAQRLHIERPAQKALYGRLAGYLVRQGFDPGVVYETLEKFFRSQGREEIK